MRNVFNMIRHALTGVAIVVASLPSTASSDPYHYNNVLIGDRAAGMGGAYTAISDDTSGLFYNPAGTVYASGSSINASMNALHSSASNYKDVLGGKDWSRTSQTWTPNFVGIVQPFAGGIIGLSIAVTDAVMEDQDQAIKNNFTPEGGVEVDEFYINFNNQDTTNLVGPSFAYKLRDDLSIGVTLYGFYRHQQLILNQQVYLADLRTSWTNQYFEVTEYGVQPVLGIMWAPVDRFSLGFSARATQILSTKAQRQDTAKLADETTLSAPIIIKSDVKPELPVQINIGAAYFASDRLLLSGDVTYFSASNSANSVLNYAVGVEYYLSTRWAVRGGVFSNLANTPKLSTSSTDQPEHVDLYGLSLSLTQYTRNNALTLGVTTSAGTGSAQILGDITTLQDLSMSTLTAFLSTTFTY